VEGDNDAGVGERLQVAFAVAAAGKHTERRRKRTGSITQCHHSVLLEPRELRHRVLANYKSQSLFSH
jgi:hypothetical protein